MDLTAGFLANLCPLSLRSTLNLPVMDGDRKGSRPVKIIYIFKTLPILFVCDDENMPEHVSNMHLLANVFLLPSSV